MANKPNIRFKGFTDDWEQRKLGECAIFNPKSELPDIFEYVDLESVVGTNILCHRTENKSSAPLRAQRLAQKKDVFYQTVRPYQMNNCIFENDEDNWVFSTGYAQLRPYNDSYFLLTLLQNDDFVKQVLDRCTGTSYPAINSNDLADIDVSIPLNENEQKKIGGHFRNLDHLITLHQRKCDETKKLKKFMLQKMFPKNGEKNPEIRFAGFTDDWEQRKLGDSLLLLKDGTHGTHADANEGPLLLSAKNIKDGTIKWDDTDRRISLEEYEKIHSKFNLKSGDVLLTIVGSIGETAILQDSESLTFQRSVAFLRPQNDITSEFLYSEIQSEHFQKELESRKSTSAQPGIYLGDLAEIPLYFPSVIDEQKKIGQYFSTLDHLITLHQRKCDKLKLIKKFMLQNMFPKKG